MGVGLMIKSGEIGSMSYGLKPDNDPQINLYKRVALGVERKTIVFFNSIGGLGDVFLIPLVIKYYKSQFPNDICILYDSIYFGHFYNRPSYIDYIVKAKRPLLANYAVKWAREMDDSLTDEGSVDINDLKFDLLVNTHVAHDRRINPEEKILSIDFANAVNRSIRSPDFSFFDLQLKCQYADFIDSLVERLRRPGRMLVGIQNRFQDPYKNHVLQGTRYLDELKILAERYTDDLNAKVLLAGDADISAPWRIVVGDWVNLDIVKNIYFKLEIFRRLDLVVGAVSGFSHITSLLRRPWQVPLIYAFPNMERVKGDSLTDYYKKYRELGGGVELGYTFLHFRNQRFNEFYREPHKDAGEVYDFSVRLLRDHRVINAAGFSGAASQLRV
jgi:hypothetical protein